MATKKQHTELSNQVHAFLTALGAHRQKKSGHNIYMLNTKAGLLAIFTHNNDSGEVFSIYGQFEDEKKAVKIVGEDKKLNRYSGKWNFHGFDAPYLLDQFKRQLNQIM